MFLWSGCRVVGWFGATVLMAEAKRRSSLFACILVFGCDVVWETAWVVVFYKVAHKTGPLSQWEPTQALSWPQE